jgi:anaerobic selenocysteine-containing dehydrogenase
VPLQPSSKPPRTGPSFPFRLTLSYDQDHYRSLVLSRRAKGLRSWRDSAWVLIHPLDAETLEVREGERIVVESPTGSLTGTARLSEGLARGTVGARFIVPGEVGFEWWNRASTPVRVRRG